MLGSSSDGPSEVALNVSHLFKFVELLTTEERWGSNAIQGARQLCKTLSALDILPSLALNFHVLYNHIYNMKNRVHVCKWTCTPNNAQHPTHCVFSLFS